MNSFPTGNEAIISNQFIKELKLIEKSLLAESFTRLQFPSVVENILSNKTLSFSRKDFFKDFLKFKSLPLQHYQPSQFGAFNATLFRNDQFTIQIYLMDGESTELHRHSFFGFNLYLEGSSVEFCFTKANDKRVAKNVFEADYKIESSSLYSPSQGRKIDPSLIHQVHRLSGQTTVLMFMHNDFIQRTTELFCPPYYIKNAQLTDLDWRKMLLLLNAVDEKKTSVFLKDFSTDKLILFQGRYASLRSFNQRSSLISASNLFENELKKRGVNIKAFKIWLNQFEKLRKKLDCLK